MQYNIFHSRNFLHKNRTINVDTLTFIPSDGTPPCLTLDGAGWRLVPFYFIFFSSQGGVGIFAITIHTRCFFLFHSAFYVRKLSQIWMYIILYSNSCHPSINHYSSRCKFINLYNIGRTLLVNFLLLFKYYFLIPYDMFPCSLLLFCCQTIILLL